jgi:hypothetical protein
VGLRAPVHDLLPRRPMCDMARRAK